MPSKLADGRDGRPGRPVASCGCHQQEKGTAARRRRLSLIVYPPSPRYPRSSPTSRFTLHLCIQCSVGRRRSLILPVFVLPPVWTRQTEWVFCFYQRTMAASDAIVVSHCWHVKSAIQTRPICVPSLESPMDAVEGFAGSERPAPASQAVCGAADAAGWDRGACARAMRATLWYEAQWYNGQEQSGSCASLMSLTRRVRARLGKGTFRLPCGSWHLASGFF